MFDHKHFSIIDKIYYKFLGSALPLYTALFVRQMDDSKYGLQKTVHCLIRHAVMFFTANKILIAKKNYLQNNFQEHASFGRQALAISLWLEQTGP